jgi:hypothetical protein
MMKEKTFNIGFSNVPLENRKIPENTYLMLFFYPF